MGILAVRVQYHLCYQKAINGQIIADFLAGNYILEEEEESKFLDETIMAIEMEKLIGDVL